MAAVELLSLIPLIVVALEIVTAAPVSEIDPATSLLSELILGTALSVGQPFS